MRFLFLLILIANVVLLAYGQGFFGTPPSEQGREPRQLMTQIHPEAVAPEAPLKTTQVLR